ncbi:hypothetical protein GCM10010191_17770 [Actinomadura vinacea]|uniref:DUF1214 domain-containing protein n=1 Tax=Actinomadura vinacea TaxID=115336 RepID=A0ABN3IN79_9ACTN
MSRDMTGSTVDWSFFSMAKYLLTARPEDPRVMDGDEWAVLLERLAEAAELARGAVPAEAVDRAGMYRGLLQLLSFGLERSLGAADPARPVFSRPWPVHLFDYGAGNPDAVYRTVVLRDDLTYRISGTLGNAGFIGLEFFDGTRQTGSLLAADLRPGPDGEFEVLFGPRERPGNWLRVVPGTSYLLTREFFGDWAAAEPARLHIECLDETGRKWPVMSADRVGKELEALGTWLVESVRVFTGAQRNGMAAYTNAFEARPSRADSDLPVIFHGFWDLAPGDGLLVEMPEPAGPYWGIQLSNTLWNTLDFANRQTSLNRAQARVDGDGMIRFVVAHADPGVPNWLDTLGHRQGAIHLRLGPAPKEDAAPPPPRRDLAVTRNDWMRSWADGTEEAVQTDAHPAPRARVVKLDGVAAELPAGAPRVSPGERRAVLDERLRQVVRMQGDART